MSKVKTTSDDRAMFWCPGCDMAHGVPFTDGRWNFNGDHERPTLRPSILVRWDYGDPPEERVCHSFVTDGRISFEGPQWHGLSGQTVDIPDWDDV